MQVHVISPTSELLETLTQHRLLPDVTFVACPSPEAVPEDGVWLYDSVEEVILSKGLRNNGIIISLKGRDGGLKKPFHLRELVTQLIPLTRVKETFLLDDWVFCPEEKHIKNKELSIDLTEREADILYTLARSFPQTVSKNRILEEVWGYNTSADTHTLETHIYRLRKKIPMEKEWLISSSSGYCIAVDVKINKSA